MKQAGSGASSSKQMGMEQDYGSQFCSEDFERQRLKGRRSEVDEIANVGSSTGFDAAPRGAARERSYPILGIWSVRAVGSGRGCALLKNKCQQDSAVVGDMGAILAMLMEV